MFLQFDEFVVEQFHIVQLFLLLFLQLFKHVVLQLFLQLLVQLQQFYCRRNHVAVDHDAVVMFERVDTSAQIIVKFLILMLVLLLNIGESWHTTQYEMQ